MFFGSDMHNQGWMKQNPFTLTTHPSHFAGSYCQGSPREQKCITMTLQWMEASKLFDKSKRSLSRTAWCSRSWREERSRSHQNVSAKQILKLLEGETFAFRWGEGGGSWKITLATYEEWGYSEMRLDRSEVITQLRYCLFSDTRLSYTLAWEYCILDSALTCCQCQWFVS